MSRWAVRKNHFVGDWSVYYDSTGGVSGEPWKRISQWFDTWREAMDYADRMARTVEVVLPRIAGCGDRVPGAPGLKLGWEFAGGEPDAPVFWVEAEGSDVIYVQPDELRPLAAALVAIDEEMERL